MKGYFSNLFILGYKNRISMHYKIKLLAIGILYACGIVPVAQNTEEILSSEKSVGKNLNTKPVRYLQNVTMMSHILRGRYVAVTHMSRIIKGAEYICN